jgi:hypothetical protein
VVHSLSRILRSAAAPTALLVVYICFFWKLTLTTQYTWLDSPDFANQVLPWFQMEAVAFHHHTFPLWNPYEWGGQSMLGQMITGMAYPLNWLMLALPLKHGTVNFVILNWYFVLIHYLGGLFCFLLCRDRKLHVLASLFAGSAFGVVGWMGATDWPQMLNGAIWAPLVFLFLLRALPAGGPVRDAALAGAFLGFSLLSGHHQLPIFVALAAGGVWIYLWMVHWKLGRRIEALRKTLSFGLFTVLVSALQTLPAIEYGRLALRWVSAPQPVDWKTPVPYFVHAMYSFPPRNLLGIVLPGFWDVTEGYIGWSVAALAALGLAARWRDIHVRIFGFVGLGGLLFSLGQLNPFHGLAYSVLPGVEKARTPAMAIFLVGFGAVVLAAYGLDLILNRLNEFAVVGALTRILYFAAAFLGILAIVKSAFAAAPGLTANELSMGAFAALLTAALFHGLRAGPLAPKTAAVLFFLVSFFELGNFATVRYRYLGQPAGFLDKIGPEDDIAEFLRRRPEPVRIGLDMNAVPYNFGDWYGIDAFEEYTASVPIDIQRIAFEHWPRMLLALNYYVGKQPPREGGSEVFTGKSGVKVYHTEDAFPRAWSVHKVSSIADERDAAPRAYSMQGSLRREAFVQGAPPPVESCENQDQVGTPKHSLNHLRLEVDMSCTGMVILSEAYAPGWQASVDGSPAKIWPAYSFLRGVIAPGGHHFIDMVYRPAPVIAGAIMTALGILGAAALLLRRPVIKSLAA